jgi:hypothetical protein
MTARKLIDLEVGLLLLKHGKFEVLKAIARNVEIPEKTLEEMLSHRIEMKRLLSLRKKTASKTFDLSSVIVGRDEKAQPLRQLHARFENRTFLPELKDIRRLYDRHGKKTRGWKSRARAEASLFQFLAELPTRELHKLAALPPATAEVSSLGLISDEILGRNRHDQGGEK